MMITALLGTACVACGTGTYFPANSNRSCTSFYCASGTLDLDSSSATVRVSCGPVNFTVTGWSGTCKPCPAGIADTDNSARTPCATCPLGTYAASGATACSPCSAGHSATMTSHRQHAKLRHQVLISHRARTATGHQPIIFVLLVMQIPTINQPLLVYNTTAGFYIPPDISGSCTNPSNACPTGFIDHDSNPATKCIMCSAPGTLFPRIRATRV